MTDEQINKQAAAYLGICWHDEGDPNNVAHHKRCSKCHSLAYDAFTDGLNPDFCRDANAVRLLLEKVDDAKLMEQIDKMWGSEWHTIADLLRLPPRTVTIAVLKGVGLWEGEG